MTLPIVATSLTRRYGARTALENFQLEMASGEIVGLVGPNGSGKTTLLKILAGFLRPTSGTARVHGLDPFVRSAEVMRAVRFAFAPPALIASFTALDHLRYLGSLHRPAASPADMEAALRGVGLWDRRDDRVATFSFGMRQRLALALSLVPMPQTLVLDEPSDGLDPVAVLEMRAVLARIRREHGVTLLLSSHLLVEVEELVDRMVVLAEGRTRFSGEPGALRNGAGRLRLRVDDAAAAREALTGRGLQPSMEGDQLFLPLDALDLEEARGLLVASGVTLHDFHAEIPSLEACLVELLREPAS